MTGKEIKERKSYLHLQAIVLKLENKMQLFHLENERRINMSDKETKLHMKLIRLERTINDLEEKIIAITNTMERILNKKANIEASDSLNVKLGE